MPRWMLADRLRKASGHVLVALAFSIPLSNALTSLLVMAFLAMVLSGLVAGSWSGRWEAVWRHPVSRASLALYAAVLLCALWSEGPAEHVGGQLARNFSLLLLPLFGLVLQEPPWARRGLLAFSAAMLLTLGLSLGHGLWGLTGGGPWALPYKGYGDAIFHMHITHNVLMSLAVLLWLGCVLAPQGLPARWRWGLLVLAGLAVFNIFWMVPGRTGYATLLAVLLTLVLLHCPPRWRLPGALAIVLLCGAALGLSDAVQDRADRTWREILAFGGADSNQRGDVNLADHRLAIWREAVEVIQQSPWLGHGTGSYRTAFCASAQPADMCQYGGGKHPHNQLLFAAIEGGLLLAVCYLAWVIALARTLWRRRHAGVIGVMGAGLWWAWMAYSMVDTPLQLLTERHLFPLLFALVLFAPALAEGKAPVPAVDPEAQPPTR